MDVLGQVDSFLVGLGVLEPLLLDAAGKPIVYIKSEEGNTVATPTAGKVDDTTQKACTAASVKEEEIIENPLESGPSRLTTNKCSAS